MFYVKWTNKVPKEAERMISEMEKTLIRLYLSGPHYPCQYDLALVFRHFQDAKLLNSHRILF